MTPAQVPPMVRGLVELVLPPENVDGWLADPAAFDGESALDLLSRPYRSDPAGFSDGVRRVVEVFHRAMQYVSVPDMPTVAEVEAEVRAAQDRLAGAL